jgi:hypothetical protein
MESCLTRASPLDLPLAPPLSILPAVRRDASFFFPQFVQSPQAFGRVKSICSREIAETNVSAIARRDYWTDRPEMTGAMLTALREHAELCMPTRARPPRR